MLEHDKPNPEQIEQLHRTKDEIFRLFRGLPAEHQASMSLAMAREVMKGEWGEWLKEVVVPPSEKHGNVVALRFPSVTQHDLNSVFSEQEAALFSDADRDELTRQLFTHYWVDEFPDDLERLGYEMLEQKVSGIDIDRNPSKSDE